MAILKTTPAAPTAINPERSDSMEHAPAGDVEKELTSVQKESAGASPRIDPELERRVVRKIDWHVTPLVTFLCKWREPPTDRIPIYSSSGGLRCHHMLLSLEREVRSRCNANAFQFFCRSWIDQTLAMRVSRAWKKTWIWMATATIGC